jgi:hypothetical protein
MTTPRSTSREDQLSTVDEEGALGGERLVEYNIFLTDAFGDPSAGQLTYVDSEGVPDTIDGWKNDDSYRRSRHLASRYKNGEKNENLRENSLARQLSEKKDQPATIRLIRRRKQSELAPADPTEPRVPWINVIPPNTKFFLESVQESRAEKMQVIDTFGRWVAMFFGSKPEFYVYTGTLLNTKNHNWKNEFQENYENYLRGTKAVEYRATMVIQYDDVIVEGYMVNCQTTQQAVSEKGVPFSFTMLVLNRSPIDPRGMMTLRFERSGYTSAEALLFNSLSDTLDLTKEGKVDDLDTFLLLREFFAGNYVPAAGTMKVFETTNVAESESSTPPGATGGTNKTSPKDEYFVSPVTSSLSGSGVTIKTPATE